MDEKQDTLDMTEACDDEPRSERWGALPDEPRHGTARRALRATRPRLQLSSRPPLGDPFQPPTRTSAEIFLSMSLRGLIFDGFEGQMARDISKMTFKKLIQFRKSIFVFRNAPSNLPVDLPRTRYLRGLRFANPDLFRVSLFTF